MSTTESIAASERPTLASGQNDAKLSNEGARAAALRFITCGSVDDGKSTLIGRLLLDSRAVLQDHLAGVTRGGTTDLALLTDGLQAEREQGITIDVAWRYFATEARKFIIGDAPGHEQYTRNMVTAASQADAAVVLVDATKLDWRNAALALLPQTRRHTLLLDLLRVPSIVFAINKLDAVDDPALAYAHIRTALQDFARARGITPTAIVPISALEGWNVVDFEHAHAGWCGYQGASLLQVLEQLPTTPADAALPLALPVQWVEKFSASADTSRGRRVFWGRVAAGQVHEGMAVQVFPSGHIARVAQVLDAVRTPGAVSAGHSAGVVLDREVDVSRGDWIMAAPAAAATPQAPHDDFDTPTAPATAPVWPARRDFTATLAWMDDEPLQPGRVYWALHGHRWVKAKVQRILHRLDIHTLAAQEATQLEPNAIGQVQLLLQEPIPAAPFAQARVLGSLILVDTASHRTAAAVLVQ
ncbi:sulfate adenylyltransferase subunit 1 [Extensimonas vulgaris]|uniref:Sulfate adenylyltransferase subunit 1 n=1 Tax=Extensimonas vulgaris TaxID=1031594 RepID=A0A369AQX3_9BURK|nr:GTP-binding protein [Extensimonas vulgaris]RCX09854.1 sulfate adenylyltransferase subunit 1 [Extensimonas vulgaris]TWI39484.1 sulfate adenylyltransferase subunit 1 [Extensimonas vulgaris]TXD13044.1 sulfate adenylyltransferase [Extensimonas vulgaris]